MSESPLLTIGIPHLNRTRMLQYAIDSCLRQRIPVHILVADQGKTDETAYLMEQYRDHPHIEHLPTEATCLWANWEAAARACDTPYFAWLQDDDEVSKAYSKCVLRAFDAFPQALCWQASCYVSPDRVHLIRTGWNGPQIGVRWDLDPESWQGPLMCGSMYFTSWALSPGVAFRCGHEFNFALEHMPTNCDLFAERIILAYMGTQGPFIADPLAAGTWNHHGQNESYLQNQNGSIVQQEDVLIEHLDYIMDNTADWDKWFVSWLQTRSVLDSVNWYNEVNKEDSKHLSCRSKHFKTILRCLKEAMSGRVEEVPASVRAEEPVLIFD